MYLAMADLFEPFLSFSASIAAIIIWKIHKNSKPLDPAEISNKRRQKTKNTPEAFGWWEKKVEENGRETAGTSGYWGRGRAAGEGWGGGGLLVSSVAMAELVEATDSAREREKERVCATERGRRGL
jgi:hypothetical protein